MLYIKALSVTTLSYFYFDNYFIRFILNFEYKYIFLKKKFKFT